MEIIGIRPSSFKAQDGTEVQGSNIYVTYPLEQGTGYGSERIYMTQAKLSKMDYKPAVGDEVEVIYNRFGKCERIVPADL